MKRASESSSSASSHEEDATAAKRSVTPTDVEREAAVSPLLAACATGNYERAKVLLDGGESAFDAPELLVQAIESSCAAEDKLRLVDLLLSRGADASLKWHRTSPLDAAVASHSTDVIKLLVQKGAKIYDAKIGCLLTYYLWDACRGGDLQIIEALLDAAPAVVHWPDQSLHWPDWTGYSVFMALDSSREDEVKASVIKLLAAKGVDVDGSGIGDETALLVACGYEAEEERILPSPVLVRALLECGACPNTALSDGRTALHLLCAADYEDFYVDDQGGEDYLDGLARFESNVVECVKLLIEHGGDADARNDDGNAPLHLAVGENFPSPLFPSPHLVRALLENGASVEATCKDGRTGLHVLCDSDYSWLFEGDDPDEFGRSEVAEKITECVRLLLDHGADVDAVDDKGLVPFVLAVENRKHEVVDLLMELKESRLPSYEDDDDD